MRFQRLDIFADGRLVVGKTLFFKEDVSAFKQPEVLGASDSPLLKPKQPRRPFLVNPQPHQRSRDQGADGEPQGFVAGCGIGAELFGEGAPGAPVQFCELLALGVGEVGQVGGHDAHQAGHFGAGEAGAAEGGFVHVFGQGQGVGAGIDDVGQEGGGDDHWVPPFLRRSR